MVRNNNKQLTSFGIEPLAQKVQHKSHMHKVMGVCVTVFIPEKNNIEKGGKEIKVSLERVGGIQYTEWDSYHRVYHGDGTFHYPQIIENRLCVSVEMYFRDMEITGSDRGTETNPKFDLLSHHHNVLFPKPLCGVAMESKIVFHF